MTRSGGKVTLPLDYATMADTLGAQAAVLDEPLALADAYRGEVLPEPDCIALRRVRAHLRAAEDELRALFRLPREKQE